MEELNFNGTKHENEKVLNNNVKNNIKSICKYYKDDSYCLVCPKNHICGIITLD